MREIQSKSPSPKSSVSDKTASKKEEKKDVPLGEIVEEASSYLKKFGQFKKYEKDITKKYQKYYDTTEALPDRWPVNFINRAWRKTQKMHKYSGRKKCWSLAISFQVMKRSSGYDESEIEAQTDVKESQQSRGDPSANESVHNPSANEPIHNPSANEPVHNSSANEPVYIRIPFSEMIDGKGCYRSETVAKNIIESPQNEEYKLIDKVPSPMKILQKKFYITLFDNQTRNAAWVYEILNKSTLATDDCNKVTLHNIFKKDESIHEDFQTPDGVETYRGTGYDRGHLAAAANHKWCQEAYDDTYLLSNIVPQQHDFNHRMWLELEEYCREIAKTEEVHNVHVYTGPLYQSSDREDKNKSKKRVEYEFVGGKAVPTHLFKVIIVENNDGKVLAPECYKMANKKLNTKTIRVTNTTPQKEITKKMKQSRKNLEPYKVEIEDIQRESGLIFEERKVKEESEDNQKNSGLRQHKKDKTWKMKWRANERQKLLKVKVTGSYTDQ